MIKNLRNITKIGVIAFLMSSCSTSYAKNVALLVGIGDYQYFSAENPNGGTDLDGPKYDVEALERLLIKKWQFKPENIHTLIDAQATQQDIMDALHNLEHQTEPGDEVLIYFSGHGTSVFDKERSYNRLSNGLSNNSGAFLPYEFDIEKVRMSLEKGDSIGAVKNNFITGQYHLKPIIQKLEKSRNILGIIDACFSEHSFRSIKDKSNRLIPSKLFEPKDSEMLLTSSLSKFNDDVYPYQNTVIISSSSKNQSSYEYDDEYIKQRPYTTLDQKPHGLFTDLLLRILDGKIDAGGDDEIISYTDLEHVMKNDILNYPIPSKRGEPQTPHFQPLSTDKNSKNLMNRPLFGLNGSVIEPKPNINHLKIKVDNIEDFNQIVDNNLFESEDNGLFDLIVTGKNNHWQLSAGNGTLILAQGNNQQLNNRINAAYWLKSFILNAPDTTKLRVNALPEIAGNVFREEDKIQLAVSVDQPSAILVFNINSQGSINVLHPIYSEENQIIAANLPKLIPEGNKIPVTAPFGLEQIIFVALSSPLTNLELNEMSNLFSGSNSTISTPETKKLSKIIGNRATAIRELNIQTFPAEVDKSI